LPNFFWAVLDDLSCLGWRHAKKSTKPTKARTASVLVDVNKSTAAYYCHRLRQLICKAVEDAAPFSGEVEVDESYFGGRRKGK